MPPPRVVRVAVRGVERRAREALAARFAVLREEIGAQAIEQMSKGRLFFAALKGPALRMLQACSRYAPWAFQARDPSGEPDWRMSSASIANCG
jgi:hypothetical protein